MLRRLKQGTPEWHIWRKLLITGTKSDMAPLRGLLPKKAFFTYVASKCCVESKDETDIERGHRLEPIARELMANRLKKTISDEYVIDGEDGTGLSPDGLIIIKENPSIDDITEAAEIKCLNNENHLEALYIHRAFRNNKSLYPRSAFLSNIGVPPSYHTQVYSYFIRLPKLQTLYFGLYNENMPPAFRLVIIKINRVDVQDDVDKHATRLKEMIAEAKNFMNWLEFENALQ
jgi:hypothetical protein